MRIAYCGFASDVKRILKPLVEECAWLTPAWCHEMQVHWCAGAGGEDLTAPARCGVDYAYRKVHLYIYPAFLDGGEAWRRKTMYHELIHGLTEVFVDYAEREMKRVLDTHEASYRDSILEEMRVRREGMVEDFARCISEHEAKKTKGKRND